jgi:hypothetical protein
MNSCAGSDVVRIHEPSEMSGRRSGARGQWWVFGSTAVLAALLFVACGGSSSHSASAPSSTTTPTTAAAPFPDVAPVATDFVNINTMTRVGDHFVGSLNGHLNASLAVAHSAKGGVYPVGTVIQLLPTEAMVKRHKGYSPSTGDWEFFKLSISPKGTVIQGSGAHVKNFLGADCASCHAAAASRFDFVCEKNHGCAPLPLTDALLATIQHSDPRPKG